MKLIEQHDTRDCGAACLSMISEFYGMPCTIQIARKLTNTDSHGTSISRIIEGAEALGFNASGLKGDYDNLRGALHSGEVKLPIIAHTVDDDGLAHFVVVASINDKTVRVLDPGKGRLNLTADQFKAIWTGFIVSVAPSPSFTKSNAYSKHSFKYASLLRGQVARFALVLAFSIVISAISICSTFVFQIVLDDHGHSAASAVEEHASHGEHSEDHSEEHSGEHAEESPINGLLDPILVPIMDKVSASTLDNLFIALIGLCIAQGCIYYVRARLIIAITRSVDKSLTLSYYEKIARLSLKDLGVRQTGEYLSRFSDTSMIRDAISESIVTLIIDVVMTISVGAILYIESPPMFGISMTVVLVYIAVVLFYRRPLEKSSRRMMGAGATFEAYLKESIDGMEAIKANCAERHVEERSQSKFSSFIDAIVGNSSISVMQDAIIGTVQTVGIACILWAGFVQVDSGSLGIGSLMTFYALLGYFIEPIRNLVELQPNLQAAYVAADRLNDILDLDTEDTATGEKCPDVVNSWRLSNVSFSYNNHQDAVTDVSFEIHKGQRIAVVGASGSGKTTIAKLLLRLYEPTGGGIYADSIPLESIALDSLRSQVAFVGQEPFLFADTIRHNLSLGESYSEDELIRSCEASMAMSFIEKMPLGLDTPLEENGANLSGGQRQCLSIARALLRKPQLLIMDEATASLDPVTEDAVMTALSGFHGDMTVIAIVHRLSIAPSCDQIIVLDDGRVVGKGTHDELLSNNVIYQRLWGESER